MPLTLFRRLAPLALVAGVTMSSGCANGPEVVVDHDRSVDFTQYKTFGFFSPLGTDRGGYQTLVSQHLKAAAQRQLEARGLKLDNAQPQLRINFSARLDEKLRVTTLPGPAWGMGYYGYRGGFYSAWPLYRDQTLVTPYNEGTLSIDLVDMARKQMVWEGVVVGSVTQKDTDDLPAAIDNAVTAVFGKFPLPGPAPLPSQ
jgi:Domain of unknown function (DUF4136)